MALNKIYQGSWVYLADLGALGSTATPHNFGLKVSIDAENETADIKLFGGDKEWTSPYDSTDATIVATKAGSVISEVKDNNGDIVGYKIDSLNLAVSDVTIDSAIFIMNGQAISVTVKNSNGDEATFLFMKIKMFQLLFYRELKVKVLLLIQIFYLHKLLQ